MMHSAELCGVPNDVQELLVLEQLSSPGVVAVCSVSRWLRSILENTYAFPYSAVSAVVGGQALL